MTLSSCGENTPSFPKADLNLTAPNGEQIAEGSIEQLYQRTSDVLLEKFGIAKEFEIKSVNFLDVKDGYVAEIHFVVNNIASHYLIVKGQQTNPTGRVDVPPCGEWNISCSGSSCCAPHFNLNTGEASCKCSSGSSSGCTLKAKCVE